MAVHKIAIIGAGPSGLAALNEFLHTDKDGTSTLTGTGTANKLPTTAAFDDIVVFEQNDKIGGVWNYSEQTDPDLPLQVKQFWKASEIAPKLDIPDDRELEKSSFCDPVTVPLASQPIRDDLLWTRSAVYDYMFTNVPWTQMSFQTDPDLGYARSKTNPEGFKPFCSRAEVLDYLQTYARVHKLEPYVRFNSSVQRVVKRDGKWVLTVDEIDRAAGTEKWYNQEFDAVYVATGRCNIPYYPDVEGIRDFAENNPGVITHSKTFRNAASLKGKKVLVVGNGISALDITQYLVPQCSRLVLSMNSEERDYVPPRIYPWMQAVLADKSIKFDRYPRIKKYHPDSVEFADGTIEKGFDNIVLATGYHIYNGFLDFEENKGKTLNTIPYAKEDGALRQYQNIFNYAFTIGDPTLAYGSLVNNPYYFPGAEAVAAMVSGVWVGAKQLPSIEVQKQWAAKNLPDRVEQAKMLQEEPFYEVVKQFLEFAPRGRVNPLDVMTTGVTTQAREIMKELFYKFSSGKLNEDGTESK